MNPLAVIPASAVEHNTRLHRTLMTTKKLELSIRKWKLIKGVFVSLWVVLLAVYAISEGADPTVTAGITVTTIALLNGIEAGELVAAYGELTTGLTEPTDTTDDTEKPS